MTEKKEHRLFIRIWFTDGEYYEKKIIADYDIQWSLDYLDPLMRKHGTIQTIIIDTEF